LGKIFFYLAAATVLAFNSFAQNEPAGRISGLVYADYFYNIQRDSGISSLKNTVLSGSEDMNGFEIRRMYLTYDHKISPEFSGRIRLEADGRTLTQNNRIGVFVKDAFLKWKDILPGHDIYFGIQPTPAFEVSEMVYGFRSLEKTILDLRGIVSSRDFGVAVRGKITGDVSYWLLFGNDSGNSPENDRYKRIYTHLSYTPLKYFVTTLYADLRFRQKKADPLNIQGEALGSNILTTALFLGLYTAGYTLGIEGFYQNSENDLFINRVLQDRNAAGVSLFGSIDLYQKLRVTARYDVFDPALNTDNNFDKRHFYILGINYRPVEAVHIIPNLLIESYEKTESRSIEASVTPRLTLAYFFL
jgi:hypothetical protein